MRITGIQHVQVNVPVARVDAAKRFYGDLLGFEEMERPQSLRDAGRDGVWYRVADGQELHISYHQSPAWDASASSQHLAFVVESLTELRSRLAGAGIDIEEAVPIEGRERFFARDPGGNRIEFLAFVE